VSCRPELTPPLTVDEEQLRRLVERAAKIVLTERFGGANKAPSPERSLAGRSPSSERQRLSSPALDIDPPPYRPGGQAGERRGEVGALDVPSNGSLGRAEQVDDLGEANQFLLPYHIGEANRSRRQCGDSSAKTTESGAKISNIVASTCVIL
jgi:hypothetical protein